MGLLFPDDKVYQNGGRQVGFNRYKQLLSQNFGSWLKVNLLTILGALPLAVGIVYAVLSSSVLVLIPASILGGLVFGPFLSGMVDAILRGMRDDPIPWWQNYKRSWRQNFKSSLLPGAVLGLLLGAYVFMGMLFWWSTTTPSLGTVALYLFSGLVMILVFTLYWPQMVLFDQCGMDRMRNIILFTVKYCWRVLGTALLQMAYWAIYLLFAPWTLVLIPFLGVWYIIFLSQFLIYDQMNKELQIEELIQKVNL